MNKKSSSLDLRLFIPSLVILILISIPFAIYEGDALETLNNIFNRVVANFGWGYIWYAAATLGLAFWFAFSKYGNVVLGDPLEAPEFSLFTFINLKIAMAIGLTLMRTAFIHWTTVAMDPPHGLEAMSPEAIALGQSYSTFLWSLPKMGLLVMTGPAVAYLLYVRKKPTVRIPEVCREVLGDKFTDGIGGKLIDILFMVSIIAGAATLVGFGAPIITSTLAGFLNIDVTFGLTFGVTAFWIVAFTISSYFGLKKSIKRLSNFNIVLALVFAGAILIVGPGMFILNFFTELFGSHIPQLLDFTFYTGALAEGGISPMGNFTVFWFAYSATWALLHGIFAARVSRGRTVKEMILVYLFGPLGLSYLMTAILGGLSIESYISGAVDIPGIIQAGTMLDAIPAVLANLPAAPIFFTVFLFLTIIFLITTMDTTAYTIAMYTSNDDLVNEEPSKVVRIVIGLVVGGIALILMGIGGLAPLEVMSGLMGIPIIFIQFITIWAAKRMMDNDKAWIHNVRPKNYEHTKNQHSA